MIVELWNAFLLRIFPIFFLMLFFPLFPLLPDPTYAQQSSITSDGSLGTRVSIDQSNYTISEGTIRGDNQFHSFGRFNVFEGESAAFTGPNSINNIIGRVTGGSESFINGLLSSDINGANLYLLNPSGVLFGPNAQLDLSGSFHVSTADYLRLGEDGLFYAAISENSILTMDPPSAFGFLNSNPKGISIGGSGLTVSEGEILSVVGGDINVEGGWLSAPSGQVNIASVASKGEVLFDNDGLRVDSIEGFGNIRMTEGTEIDANGEGGGKVCIRGGKLVLENSDIYAETGGNMDGDGIGIDLTDSASLRGGSISTGTEADGDAGDIRVEVSDLKLTKGSFITSVSGGSGEGGNIVITATDSVTIQAGSIESGTSEDSSGNGGKVSIFTSSFTMKDSSYIDNSSYGIGKAGDVTIEATNAVSILEESSINSQTEVAGPAGSIKIASPLLKMADGSHISGICDGDGDGGDITLTVGDMDLTSNSFIANYSSSGTGEGGDIVITASDSVTMQAGGMGSGTSEDSSGNGGKVSIFTSSFTMKDSSYIDNSSYGIGKAGDVTIEATNAVSILEESSINSQTEVAGPAGSIKIASPLLKMADGSHISGICDGDGDGGDITLTVGDMDLTSNSFIANYSSSGTGEGGDIVITASDSVTMQASSLESGTDEKSSGKGGDITLEVSNLQLTSASSITSASSGGGQAGNITITSKEKLMLEDSLILTEAEKSDGGNIKINNDHMVMLINGQISSSVNGGPDTVGGNISIDPEFVILKDSKIIANAFEGKGGNIDIVTDVFLTDSNSKISASSDRGIDGSIDIRAAFSYLSENPASMSEDFRSAVELLREPCLARMRGGKYNSLVVNGRDAFPVGPGGLLPSPAYTR
jgi:filamentous hemagglutinin family protein